jgi:hypothetical protein
VFEHTESSLYKAPASPNTAANNFPVTPTSIFIAAAVNAGDVTLLVPTDVEDVGSAGSTGGTYVEVVAEPGTGVLLGM